MAVQLQEMDDRVTFLEQLQEDRGPVVLINKFTVLELAVPAVSADLETCP
jgi:hypothetical protein